MADQPAQYLQENIGEVLSRALAEMAVAQPKDGVDFLATWLKVYAEQEEVKIWREREEKLLKEEREKTERLRQVKEAKIAKKMEEKKVLEDMYSNLKMRVEDENTQFEDKIWYDVMDVLLKWCGVEAVYLGALDEAVDDPESKVIQYEYASTGSEDMKEKILKSGQGVTFEALQEKSADEAKESEKEKFLWRPKEEVDWTPPPDDVDPPPERPCLKYYPVSVKCVTDVDKIHYFQMTRLGAYLAVPLLYKTYYTMEALDVAKEFEREQKKKEDEKRAKEEAKQAAIEKGEEPPPDDEPAEPVEEKKLDLTPGAKLVKKIICMDTLGKNSFIDESKIPAIIDLFKAIGDCKERTEIKHVNAQALQMIDDATRNAEWEEIDAFIQQTKPALDNKESSMLDSITQEVEDGVEPQEKNDLIKKEYVYELYKQVALQFQDKIMAMRSWVCVNPKVANVVAASILMYTAGSKFDKESIFPKRKTDPDWKKMSVILDENYFQGVERTFVINERKGLSPEQKLSYVKGLVDGSGFDMATAKEVSPAFAVLFLMIQAACEYRDADVKYRTAKYKKDKEAAEKEGREPVGVLLSEQCDDCVDA